MNIGSKLQVAKTFVTSKAGRQIIKAQKNSPHLLFGAGVIGVVATTVVACRATLRLEEVLEANEIQQESAKDLLESGDSRYSASDYTKDCAKLKTRLIVDVARLYAPAFGLGVASVCALTGSHVIMTKRNAAVTAAYVTVSKAFAEYRERVTEEFGPDKDRELLFGKVEREIVETDEKGRDVVKTITEAAGPSQYARIWDADTSTTWSPIPDYNLVTLRAHQAYANDKLKMQGHLLLNDVFDMLGLSRTKAGCVVGWVADGKGDNFVDFGIFDNPDRFSDFITGREGAILLDFNVDGLIYNLI